MTFLEETLELYRNRPRELTVPRICEDTGLNQWWLYRFVEADPSRAIAINMVQILHDYLLSYQAMQREKEEHDAQNTVQSD